MQESLIHISAFQGEYKTGLIFSMIDGLKNEKSLKLICDQSPQAIEELLKESGIQNIKWESKQISSDQWQLTVQKIKPKNSTSQGCCGMCGAHNTEDKDLKNAI